MRQPFTDSASVPASGLRPWERLSVRLACLLTAVTLLAVAAVGGFAYKRHPMARAQSGWPVSA